MVLTYSNNHMQCTIFESFEVNTVCVGCILVHEMDQYTTLRAVSSLFIMKISFVGINRVFRLGQWCYLLFSTWNKLVNIDVTMSQFWLVCIV